MASLVVESTLDDGTKSVSSPMKFKASVPYLNLKKKRGVYCPIASLVGFPNCYTHCCKVNAQLIYNGIKCYVESFNPDVMCYEALPRIPQIDFGVEFDVNQDRPLNNWNRDHANPLDLPSASVLNL